MLMEAQNLYIKGQEGKRCGNSVIVDHCHMSRLLGQIRSHSRPQWDLDLVDEGLWQLEDLQQLVPQGRGRFSG